MGCKLSIKKGTIVNEKKRLLQKSITFSKIEIAMEDKQNIGLRVRDDGIRSTSKVETRIDSERPPTILHQTTLFDKFMDSYHLWTPAITCWLLHLYKVE